MWTVRALAAIAAMALCASPGIAASNDTSTTKYTSPFDVVLTPTAAVPAGDRVSADQQFAKSWGIRQNVPTSLSAFRIDLPGRVFFSHAAAGKLTGDVLALVKVSGKSSALVDGVRITFEDGKPLTPDEIVTLRRDMFRPQHGALLIEVELARRNTLRTLLGRGADGVVLENVLYSSEYDVHPSPDTTDAQYTTTTLSWDNGALFVSDKVGSVSVGTVTVQSHDGNVQVELAAVNTSNMISVSPSSAGNLTLFVGELIPEVVVRGNGVRTTGLVCIADGSGASNTTYRVEGPKERVSYPGQQPRSFECTKRPLPERMPVNTEGPATTGPSAGAGLAELGATTYALTGAVALLLAATTTH